MTAAPPPSASAAPTSRLSSAPSPTLTTAASTSTTTTGTPGVSQELYEGFPPCPGTSRVKISDDIARRLRNKEDTTLVYVGRGGHGLPHSVWGNPFRIGKDGPRHEVVKKYRAYLGSSGLDARVQELCGCTLVCHCDLDQECHADVLVELAEARRARCGPPEVVEIPDEGSSDQGPGRQEQTTINVDHSECMDVDGYVDGSAAALAEDGVPGGVGRGPPWRAMHMGSPSVTGGASAPRVDGHPGTARGAITVSMCCGTDST